jgi:hypothetical protein
MQNKQYEVFINKKQVILTFTKLRFEIQLYMESIAKKKVILLIK